MEDNKTVEKSETADLKRPAETEAVYNADDAIAGNNRKKVKLSKEEQYKLTRDRLKEADRRWRENRKAKFDQYTPEEKEQMKNERRMEEEKRLARLVQIFGDNDDSSGDKYSVTVCIDLSFDSEHNERERRSLCKQLCFGYGYVKKMTGSPPLRMYMTGVKANDPDNSILYDSLVKQGVKSWYIQAYNEGIHHGLCADSIPCFPVPRSATQTSQMMEQIEEEKLDVEITSKVSEKSAESVATNQTAVYLSDSEQNQLKFQSEIPVSEPDTRHPCAMLLDPSTHIILSPDATEVIETFDSDKVYIIGGIVDRSVRSARTLNASKTHAIKAMRLPIQEYIPTRQTHVLNIDTVLRIICLYKEYGGDWKRCLEEAVPLRKQGKSRR